LSKIIKASRPDFIIIEDVFRGPNAKTTKLLSRFSGVAIEVSRRMVKKEPVIAAATKVRSFFELKTKEDAFNFIRQKYKLDWEFSKMNDVADALLLSLYLHKSS
jgi:Holliday junction resolvasome RuvABC endonuclease subunit